MLTPEQSEALWGLVEPGEAYRELNLEWVTEELGKWAVEVAEMVKEKYESVECSAK